MSRRRYQLGASIVLLGLFTCMGPEDGPDYSVLPRELTPDELALTQATDRFGLKLFREVVDQDVGGGNIFISPLSISIALGMTANGAASSTLTAMRSTLELGDLTEEESNQAYQSLIELLLEADPQVQFDLANSIWTADGWTFLADFLQRTRDYFDAEVRSEDFTAPATVDLINSWIEGQTNGKITDMLDVIPSDAVMYLINAIYFKGTWLYEFDAVNTVDDDFTMANGASMPIRMMKQEADLLYGREDDFQMVDLPYGDGLFRMTILLPSAGVHVDSLVGMHHPSDRLYQEIRDYWAVGASATVGAVGFEADVHLLQIVDFLAGWVGIDFLHDDFAHTRALRFDATEPKLLAELSGVRQSRESLEAYREARGTRLARD